MAGGFGITGLALDPNGEQIQQAGVQIGAGATQMYKEKKAEEEANSPVHPLAAFALQMRALQQEFPGRSPDELGKILQMREMGHPAFAPPQSPQEQQTQPQQPQQPQPSMQAPPSVAPAVGYNAGQQAAQMMPPPDQAASPGQQLAAPAPQGNMPSIGAPPAPGPGAGPSLGNIAAAVPGMAKSMTTGVPQPSTQLPAPNVQMARPPAVSALGDFAAELAAKSAQPNTGVLGAAGEAPSKRSVDTGPIVLDSKYSAPIRNKDFAQIDKALSAKGAEKAASDAVKLQIAEAANQRELLRQRGQTLRADANLSAKDAIVKLQTDTKLTTQAKQLANDIYMQLLRQQGVVEAIGLRARSGAALQNPKLRIELFKAGLKAQTDLTNLAVKAGTVLDPSPEAVATMNQAVSATLGDLNGHLGYVNGIGSDLGEKSAFPSGPAERGPGKKETTTEKAPGVRGLFGGTVDKTVETPGPELPRKPAQGVPAASGKSSTQPAANGAPRQDGKVRIRRNGTAGWVLPKDIQPTDEVL